MLARASSITTTGRYRHEGCGSRARPPDGPRARSRRLRPGQRRRRLSRLHRTQARRPRIGPRRSHTQAIAPPNGLVIYSVSGTAIPNDDGFWVSLSGAGYDLAKTLFNGIITIQSNVDPAKSTLTYVKQSLNTSSIVILTGTPELKACP